MGRFIKSNGMHRTLEGWPLVFTVLTTLAILVGGLVEFLPLVLVNSAVDRIETVEPWTPLELEGRDIYIAEGCNTCHSQMVRPFRHEIERYARNGGGYSKAGETVYERPFLWGSKRTGPDLAREGLLRPQALWHVRHMEDPRSTSKGSIMPPYPHLLEKDIDFDGLTAKLRTLKQLGTPYSEETVKNAASIAREQAQTIAKEVEEQGGPTGLENKKIMALVAYLQSLGTDVADPEDDVANAESASDDADVTADASR
ncbi:cytochrome-c oxidase, cbb3-type subunit II [Longibacter salinarum]|uniref:Cytochrome-c oxidase, cbb3-type subunit II n=1 Tax=Longibacter salinarum TaxID=1850348 RepID=A0A2A8CXW7_9BACT|nr:cytochrome-c oxidase, cbb3-type subunit II [Longibacter salinarum]PEN13444.1 cytochrome-c oxidase, cbb3-type subunit II [Longibacter salinarum]